MTQVDNWALVFAGFLVYFSVRTASIVYAGVVFLKKTKLIERKRIYRQAFREGQFRSELKAVCRVVLADAFVISLATYFELVQYAVSDLKNTILTFLILFLWYEVTLYFLHRLMHSNAFYFIHAQHHSALVAHPLTVLSFSVTERVILMSGILIFPILVSPYLPISKLGIVIYGLLNLILSQVGHFNAEFFPRWFGSHRLGKYLNTPTYHAMHHARQRGNYGLITTIMDRLCGTYFEDYPKILEMAADGEGPTHISFRVERGAL